MPTNALHKLTSSPRSVSTLIHITGLLSFTESFLYLPYLANPLHHGFGGSFKFLTVIALTVSTITFGVGLLADVTLNKQLYALKNTLAVWAAPLDVLVCILYWSIRAVVPREYELPFIPDFSYHGMPAIMLTLDLVLLGPPWLVKTGIVMTFSLVSIFVYWGWLEYCFSFNGW